VVEEVVVEEGVGGAAPKTGSQRTDIYLFDSSQNVDVDCARLKEREQLHRRFVKKLGHPDSLTRRGDDGGDREEEVEDGDEEEAPPAKPSKTAKGKSGKNKLTPMEIQFLEIKRKHVDTVLIVEVGYKFKFFGEDARIAAKVLSIVCIPGKMRFDERKFRDSQNPWAFANCVGRSLRSPYRQIRLGQYSGASAARPREATRCRWLQGRRGAPD
jgi:hypothetical protein